MHPMEPGSSGGIVVVENLTKRFGAVEAVSGLDFAVPKGGITALLGANGAGKSTTIAILLGLLKPTSGRVTVMGVDMAQDRHRALAAMNFSSPYVNLPARISVRENLVVYGHLYGVRNLKTRIVRLADELDLGSFLDRPTGSLSAGETTRVALAKAFLNEPRLLLLDEPTASLDPDTGDWVRTYLERYRETTGATILLASHNMAEVERLADRVLMMKAGRIVATGAPKDLIERYGRRTMEEVFLDIARGRSADGNGAAP